ncbi:aspergillopepsin-F [Magnaporthiopsis poae ATCC 64411]|uniref:Aspergillopepsin-F n=1 Tax=Magnaporthiopsis poae (strain ATCC 64411 / 73-15) TaxID=644358 RepID=A0A0C4ECY9_MAGP6|nr:aspergillopepsin-F [Magnaporthiopsis poae ATCC 64411]
MPPLAKTLAVLLSVLVAVSASPVDTKVGGTVQQGAPQGKDLSVKQVPNTVKQPAGAVQQGTTQGKDSSVKQVASPVGTKGSTVQQGAPQVKDFSVKQVANPNGRVVKSGAVALAQAYANGSATAMPLVADSEYMVPMKIGTPPVTLNVNIDTGSADLWVFSDELPKVDQTGHNVYWPSRSTTAKQLSGSTFSIKYGDGSSASGSVYKDVVEMGGVKFAKQAVEAASVIAYEFTKSKYDGVVGLALGSANTVKPRPQKTFFENIKGSLSSPVLGIDLKKGKPGNYDFGTLPRSRYTGDIAYVPSHSKRGAWNFTASAWSVGGGKSHDMPLTGIVDTGTTLLLLPPAVVRAYYEQIPGWENSYYERGVIFPCSATPPDFSFKVGSNTITIPGSYVNYTAVSSTKCFGGIQSNDGLSFSIFGNIALKAAYVVLDMSTGAPRVGWASKKL